MNRVSILGIPIDVLTRTEAVQRMMQMLAEPSFHHVMTPNSEMLVEASRNPSFHVLLHRTDVNIADSAGMLWAAKRTGQFLPERVTGVDTVIDLCQKLSEDTPVFLLGAWGDTALKAAQVLQKKNPHLRIVGSYAGSPKQEDAEAIIQMINTSGAYLLLVAFGAPKQDLWIDAYRDRLIHVRVAMGVGGTFDFIAGVHKRAPKIFQNLEIEWLWRLMREPKRFPRIWRAVVVFPLKILAARS